MIQGQPQKHYHLRTFIDLLYDAAHLAYLAHDVNREGFPNYRSTYVRSSILSCVLLLECGANCCVDSLALPRKFRDELDKLSFLSKYQYFLGTVNKVSFNRGCIEVQAASDLKSLRDLYVHPKVEKRYISQAERKTWGGIDFGKTPHLNIPKNPKQWSLDHAVVTLRAANDFFNLYFLTWCAYDSSTVCEILFSPEAPVIPAPAYVFTDVFGELDRARDEWNIDFRFIGKE